MSYDVAIVGGGPAGSTAAALLKKYNPELRVLVLERAKFPRDHVGESQLPSIGPILNEMGVWDKVEAANFPVKVGASYTWGASGDRWDFDFYPLEEYGDLPRPGKYEGPRKQTAFQVDRAIYDEILLDHAEELGAEVRQEAGVKKIHREGDRITSLELSDGSSVEAKHYIDATGTVGLFRKAFDIGADVPETLKNIAIWDYWENAKWAVEIGVGGTRVQVRSLPYGWMWFIPLGPTRTSIGLVCPAEHYKACGKTPEELYLESIEMQGDIHELTVGAEREGNGIETCKDYSNLPERLVGENWFLIGEAAGFADPILAAGMTIAHSSARDCAYTILELERAEQDDEWLRDRFDGRNRANVEQHIRFAQYWYSANSNFTDLQEHCAKIAKEAGLKLRPEEAWRWLSQGGFATEFLEAPSIGSFDVSTMRQLISRFDKRGSKSKFLANGYNVFELNLKNAEKKTVGNLKEGRIVPVECWVRGEASLPATGLFQLMIDALTQSSDIEEIFAFIKSHYPSADKDALANHQLLQCMQVLDTMISDHWVIRSINKKKGKLRMTADSTRYMRDATISDEAITSNNPDLSYVSNI